MAYFTDPMGDEFKKAIEEAMKELDAEESASGQNKESTKASRKKKNRKSPPMNQLSKTTKKALK
jgi:hypothetical protein